MAHSLSSSFASHHTKMTLESNSVNQTPVEVESSETEEEEEQPKGQKKRSLVWIDFEELKLKKDYVRIHAPSSDSSSTLGKRPRTTNTSNELDHGDMLRRRMKTGQSSSSSTSELDKYNGEFCEPFDKNVHFDIAQWWKVNSQRFPILSLMARDLLAIPISTVASESVFSTSGRVLDSYRSSLGDKTIECLVCAQDWLRISLNPKKEEDMDTIAKIEKELMEQEGARLNDGIED
ncbi:zinc finger BED domain-containing protein RICESLEEPER 2-like protein [Tanacetum coccineum]